MKSIFTQRRLFALCWMMVSWATHASEPAALASGTSSGLPFKQAGAADAPSMAVVVTLVVLSVALITSLCFSWYRKRANRSNSFVTHLDWRCWMRARPAGKAVSVSPAGRLNVRMALHVVEWDGKELLVASSDQFATVLSERVYSLADQKKREADA